MATLTYSNDDRVLGGVLTGRVLVGRRLARGLMLTDPTVSRLHAWIDPTDGENLGWVITDAGSKAGTFVNEQKITQHTLTDGDEIRVGAAKLTFHDTNAMHPGITPVDLSSATGVTKTSGILFDCACGAPLWVSVDLAGKRGLCRHCRQPITVPETAEAAAAVTPPKVEVPAVAPPSAAKRRSSKCAVCHAAIEADEEMTTCPDCAVTFHAECWQENLGCSTYGCPQVNALQSVIPFDSQITIASALSGGNSSALVGQTPWGVILLAASAVGSLLGALLFGSIAAVVAVVSAVMLIRTRPQRSAPFIAAIVISLLGILVGLIVSDFWYFHARHLPSWIATVFRT